MAQKLDEELKKQDSDKKHLDPENPEILQVFARKRNKYVVLALGDRFNRDLRQNIHKFLGSAHKKLSIVNAESAKDLLRLMNRQIELVIIDDSFTNIPENIQLIQALKRRKQEDAAPVLFLTEDASALIEAYNQYLKPYQEVDLYLNYHGLTNEKLIEGIRFTLEAPTPRRSRRYTIDWPVQLACSSGKDVKCRLIDMSLHGALLVSEDNHIFHEGEQFKMRIPLNNLLPISFGEFMKLSGKVRRVSTAGNKAGIRWEYLNDQQLAALTQLLMSHINHR